VKDLKNKGGRKRRALQVPC